MYNGTKYTDVLEDSLLINSTTKEIEVANISLCDRTKNVSCSLTDDISLGINVALDQNLTSPAYENSVISLKDPYALQMTIVYLLILMTGLIGNICTCIVISKNRSMHTATNYYLFSLAVSDILSLLFGLPEDLHNLWIKSPYIFGEVFCIARGWGSETSTNASVLTITAFSVERFFAICHPVRAHVMSRLSRAVKIIIGIWILAALSAVTMAYQIGIVYEVDEFNEEIMDTSVCTIKRQVDYSFECSTLVFFIIPGILMLTIYPLMSFKLMSSKYIARKQRDYHHTANVDENTRYQEKELNEHERSVAHKFSIHSRTDVIKMLVAVVIVFFICWAPFHAQRLMAIYITSLSETDFIIFRHLTNISGILYYVSATINPILYNLMSSKFREAFRDTLRRSSQGQNIEDMK